MSFATDLTDVAKDDPLSLTSEIFDLKRALERIDGDEEIFAEVAKVFCDEAPRMLLAVQEAVLQQDAEGLLRAAHSLKGSISVFAAEDAVDIAHRLELLGRAKGLRGAEELCASLVVKVARLRVALQEIVAAQASIPR